MNGSLVFFFDFEMDLAALSISPIFCKGVLDGEVPFGFLKHSGSWKINIPFPPEPPRKASSIISAGSRLILPESPNSGSLFEFEWYSQGEEASPLLHDPRLNDSSHIWPS